MPRSVVPKTKPTNYLLIDRANNPVKGTYTIVSNCLFHSKKAYHIDAGSSHGQDPFMSIPQSFLPQLAAGETESGRKNLKVWSKNGSVDIDVTLLADSTKHGVDGKKRATLDVGSQNGSINIKLVRQTSVRCMVVRANRSKSTGSTQVLLEYRSRSNLM